VIFQFGMLLDFVPVQHPLRVKGGTMLMSTVVAVALGLAPVMVP
jgi:hypothetical protein